MTPNAIFQHEKTLYAIHSDFDNVALWRTDDEVAEIKSSLIEAMSRLAAMRRRLKEVDA